MKILWNGGKGVLENIITLGHDPVFPTYKIFRYTFGIPSTLY